MAGYRPPPFWMVLAGLGGFLAAGTIGAALLDPAPYFDSLVQGGLALGLGTALLAAAARLWKRHRSYRSWRAVGWTLGLVGAASVEVVWSEVVAAALGQSTFVFSVLSSIAAGASSGAVLAWYDRSRRVERRYRLASERNYHEIFDGVRDGIIVHDPETGEILDANSAAERVYGYPKEQLQKMDVGEFSATDEGFTQELAERRISEAIEQDGVTFEWLNEQPDGERLWLEVSLKPATINGAQRVLAVVRDIDDRKERQRELRLKDRALEAASIGITIADADGDQPLVYVNDAFLDQTGYAREDVLGCNCRSLQGPDTDEAAVAELHRAIDAAEPTTVELLNYRRDDTPFWNEVTLAPVTDDGGVVTHYVGFQRDVTERKRRERAFSVVNRILRHNLRNDLMVVSGNANLLAETLDDEYEQIAERIESTADELTELGEKARELEEAVTADPEPRPHDVDALVESAAEELREEYPDATIAVDIDHDGAALATDRTGRALWELGENALDHAGSVVQFRVRPAGDDVLIEVCDDGDGLPEMERDVLATGTETPLRHGQGVGLWLVTWLVTNAGGRLEAAPDGEATVTVRLPTAAADDPTPGSLLARDQ